MKKWVHLFLMECIVFSCEMTLDNNNSNLTITENFNNACLTTVQNNASIKHIKMSGLNLTNSDFLKYPRIFSSNFKNLLTEWYKNIKDTCSRTCCC